MSSVRPLNRPGAATTNPITNDMLQLAIWSLIIALIAAILGFGGVAGAFVGVAKICFFVFLVLFIIGAVSHMARGRRA